MKKAVFLDRDGTINEEVDVLRDKNQLRLIPRAGEAIKLLNEAGFLTIVITNQPVIARGWLTHEGLKEVHDLLEKYLSEHGAKLDAIYYCPHHPDANLEEYKMACECRKPGAKLITDALKDFDIDPSQSFMVGDHTRDILAGQRAGVKSIMVQTGHAGTDGKNEVTPDFTTPDLYGAALIITNQIKNDGK